MSFAATTPHEFQFCFSASHMWNKTLKQFQSSLGVVYRPDTMDHNATDIMM